MYIPTTTLASAPGEQILSYVEFSVDVSVTSAVEASADVVVTAASISADGGAIHIVEFYTPALQSPGGAADRFTVIMLWDSFNGGASATLGRIGQNYSGASSLNALACLTSRRLIPAAGTHVYSVRAIVNAGTGLVQAGVGGSNTNLPGYIKVSKVFS